MAARAVAASRTRAPERVAGVASLAVHGLITVPRTATVLGTSDYAIWLLVDDSVVVVSTRDATRLPNGIEIAAKASDGLFTAVGHGASVDVGFGKLTLNGPSVEVVRWWDPKPALPGITVRQIGDAVAGLPTSVPGIDGGALGEAVRRSSISALLAAARPLLGMGSGLTPEGDDFLAGTIAGARILGEAVGHVDTGDMLDRVARPLTDLATARTTTFSAALIRYAVRGQVAEPAGCFLRALAGRGDVAATHSRLRSVGHSSGPALAAGIVLGAEALIQSTTDSDRRYT